MTDEERDEIARLKTRLAALEDQPPAAAKGGGCLTMMLVGVGLALLLLFMASRQPSLDTQAGRDAVMRDALHMPPKN